MNANLYNFPCTIEVANSNTDGVASLIHVYSVGYLFCHDIGYYYRLLCGHDIGYRLEVYNGEDEFVCQFQYESSYEAYADLMRFDSGQLEFEFNDSNEVIGKIYKYRTE